VRFDQCHTATHSRRRTHSRPSSDMHWRQGLHKSIGQQRCQGAGLLLAPSTRDCMLEFLAHTFCAPFNFAYATPMQHRRQSLTSCSPTLTDPNDTRTGARSGTHPPSTRRNACSTCRRGQTIQTLPTFNSTPCVPTSAWIARALKVSSRSCCCCIFARVSRGASRCHLL
jgi:hypothetical protein